MRVSFEDLLNKDGRLVYKTRGVSMEPMLRQNRDLVVIEVPAGRLAPYDVAFYKRRNNYVLHRVIKVKDDCYMIRGDNTFTLETVPDGAVIGVLTAFQRKGKMHYVTESSYRLYARLWNAIYPLRALYVRSFRLAVKVARKLGILPLIKKILRRS